MSKLETNQVDPATGTTLTLGTSGDTITIPSGVTIANSGTATGFGNNTPAFHVRKSGNQDTSTGTATTVTWETEDVDTDSAFASNTFTVPSGAAGKYHIYAMIRWNTDTDFQGMRLTIRKNSSNHFSNWGRHEYYETQYIGGMIDLAAGDTVDVQVRQTSGGTVAIAASDSGTVSFFGGYKLIGV
jgi:hypothetical protein